MFAAGQLQVWAVHLSNTGFRPKLKENSVDGFFGLLQIEERYTPELCKER